MASTDSLPSLRWGIIATGIISSRFAADLQINRPDVRAHHSVVAVGSSTLEKAQNFIKTNLTAETRADATPYASYEGVYNDPNVQAVYIGTPHIVHKKNALDAIAAGKHVLCEKPFTLNARDAKEIFDAAKAKGVFVMEAVWTRFFPIVQEIKKKLHEEKIIGDIYRSFAEYSIMDYNEMDPKFRLRDPKLGGGALLDIGIYTVTWTRLVLDPNVGDKAAESSWTGSQILKNGVDVHSAGIASYPTLNRQGIWSCSLFDNFSRDVVKVEGSLGTLTVVGKHHSCPQWFKVEFFDKTREPIRYEPPKEGFGFYWEADAVAVAIAAGKLEEENTMPWKETLSVMEILDNVRKSSGLVYPQERA
ncbi:hypothetical protein DV495_004898 [Geotrichum candidum]|nr:hypothetical protein DV495_004898 [Geotrichum candidum]